MDSRAKRCIEKGDHLFGKKMTLDSLWQHVAEQFYVERADFTRTRYIGEDFAAHLYSSYPMMVRRDLQNSLSTMLRPPNQVWYSVHSGREDLETGDSKKWLEWAGGTMYRAVYDRRAQFNRATKEGDGDFATFGQAVIQPSLNRERDGLLFRTWHLRDCAWCEGYDGTINELHRKWKPTLGNLAAQFKGKIAPALIEELSKPDCDYYRPVECRHVVMPMADYDMDAKYRRRFEFVSLYIDVENEFVLEETPVRRLGYVVPRWVTVSGWQYAFSPASVIALPDARLIQSQARVLLEAGERATFPPMLTTENAIRGDVNNYPAGITVVDARYEGKLSEALMQMEQSAEGLKIGMEMSQDTRMMLREAFFLDKLTAPNLGDGPPKTQLEVSQIVSEYIRGATPLFEPMESEYNGALCEEVFAILLENGAFGRASDIPKPLQGQNLTFRFISPLTQALGQEKLGKYQQAGQIIAQAMQLDPGAAANIDSQTALRDTLDGVGTPAKWLNTEQQTAKIRAKIAQDQQVQAEMNQVSQGAQVADQVGKASQSLTGKLPAPQTPQAQAA